MPKRQPLEPEAYTPWMQALVARKTRKRFPAWLEKLPDLHDGQGILPEPVVEALVKQLAEDPSDGVIADLRSWAAPKTCGAFGKKLLTTWKARKFKKADDWLYTAGAALAEDATAKTMLSMARSFRNGPRHDRVPGILADVAAIGTDDALRELILLSRSHDGFIGHVDTALAPVAKARGLSVPNLIEEMLPSEEFLLSLDKPKSLPSICKKHGVPELIGRDGEPVGKAYHLAVVRALVEGGGTWRTVKHTVAAKVDPESAATFALALLNAWIAEDFHGRYDWIGTALGAMGDDRVAFGLKPHLKRLSHRRASDSDRKKAMGLMHVFGDIGTDSALLVLIGLGQANTRPSVFEAAWGVIRQAAGRRRITPAQLEDRVAPDCGLDERGGRVFDYGPRQFHLVFDEDFRPRLRHPDGGLTESLPAAASGDDAEKVEACLADWALMSRQLEEILDIQTERLRRSMVQGRRWSAEDWTTWILGHPLMVNYAQRLVWALHDADGKVAATVRAAEDRTLVDLEDDEVPLGDHTVSLAHPAMLSADDRGAWSDHLADYEILQPFPQLGRPVHIPSEAEATAEALTRWASANIDARQLYESLLGRGWDRDGGYGQRIHFMKHFPDKKLQAGVKMDPGYSAGGIDWAGPQSLPKVWFASTEKGAAWDDESADLVPLDQVDPVVFSEVVVDVVAAASGEDDEHARRVRG